MCWEKEVEKERVDNNLSNKYVNQTDFRFHDCGNRHTVRNNPDLHNMKSEFLILNFLSLHSNAQQGHRSSHSPINFMQIHHRDCGWRILIILFDRKFIYKLYQLCVIWSATYFNYEIIFIHCIFSQKSLFKPNKLLSLYVKLQFRK